jgi:2',3'-cyclic-nucleotide 2'-phosphodiesterase / 3'-nucleotidase
MYIKIYLILLFSWAVHLYGQEVTIRIAATSDVHGALFPYDFLNNNAGAPSLASLQTFTDSVRGIPGSNLILLDNGDLIQGTPTAYFANFIQEDSVNLFARVLNHLKFDAATVGNHDIEAGPEVYYRLQGEFHFPWLGANIINTNSGKPAFEPYTIIEREGIRIAVLGLITPGVPGWLPQTLWPGLQFEGIIETARQWVDHILVNEKPDAIIGLFHTGLGQTGMDGSGNFPENAGHLAALNVPGLNVIITGHDHRPGAIAITTAEGQVVHIVNPGSSARNIAYAELVFTKTGNSGSLLKSAGARVISIEKTSPSDSYMRKFRRDIKAARAFSNQKVGRLANALSAREGLFQSSAFTDLIHEVQLNATGAGISFTAPLTISENLNAGSLRVRDLFKLYRYENFLYVMELSGKEIKDFLEYSCSLWFNHMENSDDHLLNLRKDSEGNEIKNRDGFLSLVHPSYNFDSAAGIVYQVDVSKPPGDRVTISGMENGQSFLENKTYKVAINSYRGSGGGGHLTKGAGIRHDQLSSRIVFTSAGDIRSIMIEYLKGKGEIAPQARKNWKIVPEEWWQAGVQKDTKSIFQP